MNRIMSKLLIPEAPLQVIPSLAKAIGLNEALFIQQLHYWSLKSKDGWVYNTYEQWQEQFPFWSNATIRRIIYSLEERKLILSRQEASTDRKKYYSVSYDQLEQMDCPMVSTCTDGYGQDEQVLITETTTIDSDLQSVEPEQEPKPKRKAKTRTAKYTIDQLRPMANAIANATRLKLEDNYAVLNKASGLLLDLGYTPEKVADFAVWWKVNDWRGKRGQPPTVWQIKTMIGGALKENTGDPASEEKRQKFLEQIKEQE